MTPSPQKTVAPYGSWPSPISSQSLVEGSVRPAGVQSDGEDVWFACSLPAEKGRCGLFRLRDGQISQPLGTEIDVKTGVNEYGGGAWSITNGVLIYSDAKEGRLWRVNTKALDTTEADQAEAAKAVALTPAPTQPRAWRYADGVLSPDQKWYVCIRETHSDADEETTQPPADAKDCAAFVSSGGKAVGPKSDLVAVATDGSLTVLPLVCGADFYSSPRIDSNGSKICWVQWDQPAMSWEATQLWVADFSLENPEKPISAAKCVSGQQTPVSILSPNWVNTATGDAPELWARSDFEEWWNITAFDFAETHQETQEQQYQSSSFQQRPIVTESAEVGGPEWVFGDCGWAFNENSQTIYRILTGPNGCQLAATNESGNYSSTKWSEFSYLNTHKDGVIAIAASQRSGPQVIYWQAGQQPEKLFDIAPSSFEPQTANLLFPDPTRIEFPTTDGEHSYGWFYEPASPSHLGPTGELPPLLVLAHGGPTSRASNQLNPGLRYWTSRGFAVVDVDYRGSTGLGRTYRQALHGRWGIADSDDAVAAALYLADQGLIDGQRMLIKGGSAGGLTVLTALCDNDIFAAGASRYGVADLKGLVDAGHKFEDRYLEALVAPWPQGKDIYEARSPMNRFENLSSPMIVLQGGQDRVVKPEQSEALLKALDENEIPHLYVYFEDEPHGFRQADSIVKALESELSFFCRVLGIEREDSIELEIVHSENLGA